MAICAFFPFCAFLFYLYISHAIDGSKPEYEENAESPQPSPSKYNIDTPAAEAIIRQHAKSEKIRARKGTPKPPRKSGKSQSKSPIKRRKTEGSESGTGASPTKRVNTQKEKGNRKSKNDE